MWGRQTSGAVRDAAQRIGELGTNADDALSDASLQLRTASAAVVITCEIIAVCVIVATVAVVIRTLTEQ